MADRDMMGNVVINPRTLMDYLECFKVNMTVYEKHMIFRMKSWALSAISELEKSEKD